MGETKETLRKSSFANSLLSIQLHQTSNQTPHHILALPLNYVVLQNKDEKYILELYFFYLG